MADGRYVTTVDITAAWEPQQVLLHLGGEVDFSNASYLEDYLSLLLEQGQHRVVVDLRRLDFIDSAGVKVLAAAARRICPAGGCIALRSVPPVVRTMLTILELDALLVVEGHGEPAVS